MGVVLFQFSRWAKAQQLFLTSPFRTVFRKVVLEDQASPEEEEALAGAALSTCIQAPS
jgi:hypothetical protein